MSWLRLVDRNIQNINHVVGWSLLFSHFRLKENSNWNSSFDTCCQIDMIDMFIINPFELFGTHTSSVDLDFLENRYPFIALLNLTKIMFIFYIGRHFLFPCYKIFIFVFWHNPKLNEWSLSGALSTKINITCGHLRFPHSFPDGLMLCISYVYRVLMWFITHFEY